MVAFGTTPITGGAGCVATRSRLCAMQAPRFDDPEEIIVSAVNWEKSITPQEEESVLDCA